MPALEIVPKGVTAWEWACRHHRREADPANHTEHVKAWKRQPGYFEKHYLPKLKTEMWGPWCDVLQIS